MKTSENKPTEKQLSAIREKREELKALSKPFKKLVDDGAIDTINEGLTALYAEQGHSDLKTLKQWNEAGKKVKKGEHAFLLWGRPKAIHKKDEPTTEQTEGAELDFFPICFVFSALQVEDGRKAS